MKTSKSFRNSTLIRLLNNSRCILDTVFCDAGDRGNSHILSRARHWPTSAKGRHWRVESGSFLKTIIIYYINIYYINIINIIHYSIHYIYDIYILIFLIKI